MPSGGNDREISPLSDEIFWKNNCRIENLYVQLSVPTANLLSTTAVLHVLYVSALSLAGAGGGGFMYILARSPQAAKKIRSILSRNPPSKWARFYDFAVDEKGMAAENLI